MEKRKKRILKLIVIASLAFAGGYVNMISLLSHFKYSISHLTGNISRLAETLSLKDYNEFFVYGALILSFFLGAIASGIILGDDEFKFKKKYGQVLMFMSILLYISVKLLQKDYELGLHMAGFVCGIQNGLIFKFEGALVRTTHLTGTVTDLGVMIGNLLKRNFVEKWTIILNLILIFSFFLGGVLGTVNFQYRGIKSLNLAGLIYLTMGIMYYLYSSKEDINISSSETVKDNL